MLDFEDYLGEVHNPRKRANAVKGMKRARHNARMLDRMARYYAVHHTHRGPGLPGELQGTYFPRKTRNTDLPIEGWERDDGDELGFLPALAAAIPAIASAAGPLISGLTGGGKKAAAPSGGGAQVVPVATGSASLDAEALKGVVGELLRTIAPPVRQQVSDAVRDQLQSIRVGNADVSKLLSDIGKQIGPALSKQLEGVNKAAIQRQATFEHEALKRQEQRWRANAEAQRQMLARLNDMENRLGQAVVSSGTRARVAAAAYGAPGA